MQSHPTPWKKLATLPQLQFLCFHSQRESFLVSYDLTRAINTTKQIFLC